MKQLITLLALGTVLTLGAKGQDPLVVAASPPDARMSAAQVEKLNKQMEEMRKQLDATQAQLKAIQGTATPPVAEATAPEPPSPPAPPRITTDSVNRIGGSYTVQKDEVVNGDVRVAGGSLTVDGVVRGDASVAGGTLRVNGEVDGDASTAGGSLYLGPEADVKGDAQCIGGNLHRDPGARVGGDIKISGGRDEGASESGESGPQDAVVENAMMDSPFPLPMAIFFALAGMALLVICPKRVDTVGRAFVNQPMYSFLVGIVSIPLAVVLLIVSAITIVGPVMVVFGMIGSFLIGVTAVAVMLGRRIALGKTYKSRFYPLIVGLGVWLLASAVSHVIPPMFVLMSIATTVAYMMALGAALATGFGKNTGWLKNRMEGNRGGTPWIDPSYTYAGNDS